MAGKEITFHFCSTAANICADRPFHMPDPYKHPKITECHFYRTSTLILNYNFSWRISGLGCIPIWFIYSWACWNNLGGLSPLSINTRTYGIAESPRFEQAAPDPAKKCILESHTGTTRSTRSSKSSNVPAPNGRQLELYSGTWGMPPIAQ